MQRQPKVLWAGSRTIDQLTAATTTAVGIRWNQLTYEFEALFFTYLINCTSHGMVKTVLYVDRTSNNTDLELRVLKFEIPSTQEQEHMKGFIKKRR